MASFRPTSVVKATARRLAGWGSAWLWSNAATIADDRSATDMRSPGPTRSEPLSLGAQFAMMAGIVDSSGVRSDRMRKCHAGAVERLDATELALRRMMTDLERVMPGLRMPSLDADHRAASVARSGVAIAA